MSTNRPPKTPESKKSNPEVKEMSLEMALGDISAWTRKGKKEGGKRSAGNEGGIYAYKQHRALFKRDDVVNHNMVEAFTAGFLRDTAAEDQKDCFPQIGLAPGNEVSTNPDNQDTDDGREIYLSVLFFENFLDLYKDALLAYAVFPDRFNDRRLLTPEYERNANNERTLHLEMDLPTKPPKLFQSCPITQKVIAKGRYKNFDARLAAMKFVNNKDIHTGNIGAQGQADKKYVLVTVQNPHNKEDVQTYKVYEGSVNTVTFDFGWALASERVLNMRLGADLKDDGNNPISPFIHYLFGTFDYEKFYSDSARDNNKYIQELNRLYGIDNDHLKAFVTQNIAKLSIFSVPRLIDFARYVGINLADDHTQTKPAILESISSHLGAQFVARKSQIPALIKEMKKPHLYPKIKTAFNYTFHANDTERSKLAAFFGGNSIGKFYTWYQALRAPLKISKNIIKLATEFLPSLLEELGKYGLARLNHYAEEKGKLAVVDYLGLFFLGIVPAVFAVTGMLLRWAGSRITSPLRSADETFNWINVHGSDFLNFMGMSQKQATRVSAVFAWAGYLLSLTISAIELTLLISICAPYVAGLLSGTSLGTQLGIAVNWLAQIPVIHTLSSWFSTQLIASFSYLKLSALAHAMTYHATALAILSTTLFIGIKSIIVKVKQSIDQKYMEKRNQQKLAQNSEQKESKAGKLERRMSLKAPSPACSPERPHEQKHQAAILKPFMASTDEKISGSTCDNTPSRRTTSSDEPCPAAASPIPGSLLWEGVRQEKCKLNNEDRKDSSADLNSDFPGIHDFSPPSFIEQSPLSNDEDADFGKENENQTGNSSPKHTP